MSFRCRALVLALCVSVAAGCAGTKPYVEEPAEGGFHLFNRPAVKNPAGQWAHVQDLQREGKAKAAAKQAYALRIFWPESEEAPEAQLLYARWLDGTEHWMDAAEQYQFLLDHYPGHCDFDEVIATQMRIAKAVMARRLGKFLFFPGVKAPEKAIPLFEKIAKAAPEADVAAEAWLLIGRAHEEVYEDEEAVNAYLTSYNRFPTSPLAEEALLARTLCQIKMAKQTPNDNRALDEARAACLFYLGRYPRGKGQAEVREALADVRARQAQGAFDRAVYYDKTLRKPEAARLEYEAFLERFPEAEHAAEAKARLAELGTAESVQEEKK